MTADGNLYALLDPATALFAGMVASLHCVGMCGPLSCSLIGGKAKGAEAGLSHGLYHAGRLISYSALGALAGGFGAGLVGWFGHNPARYAPWAFAVFFLVLGLGLDGAFTRWQSRRGFGCGVVRKAYRLSGGTRGGALGLLTPLIPCGPLYLMLWATTLTGSAADGAWAMAAYCVGTMPLLLLGQFGWGWLSFRSRPQTMERLRRGLALAAVAVVCVRAFVDTDVAALTSEDALCR